jgi:hypothetical protein
MGSGDPDETRKKELIAGLRDAREDARRSPDPPFALPPYSMASAKSEPLRSMGLGTDEPPEPPSASPDREELNRIWDIDAGGDRSAGRLSRWLGPLRSPLRRVVRFALGPAVENQVRMNSAQVRFDNELVRYLDERFDRMARHYDRVLGLHGRRMEEIDERHLILQQELVRHVHDLVARIELTFEAAEQNHLYLEGTLRETREEVARIAERLAALERALK